MRIKVVLNLGRGWPDYKEGQTVDAEEDTAKELIRRGWAEPVKVGRPKGSTNKPKVQEKQADDTCSE